MNEYYKLPFILLFLMFFYQAYSQKKTKNLILSEETLKISQEYRSIDEALSNKKKVIILNLENQKLSTIPKEIEKLQNLQILNIPVLRILNLVLNKINRFDCNIYNCK